jgi:hypothetical protein
MPLTVSEADGVEPTPMIAAIAQNTVNLAKIGRCISSLASGISRWAAPFTHNAESVGKLAQVFSA